MTVVEDWYADMSEVSAIAFRAAVDAWRRSTERFKPTPGQILAMIEPLEEVIRARLATAQDALELELSMTPAQRVGHLRDWLAALDFGGMPLAIVRSDYPTRRDYIDAETDRMTAEIKQLQLEGAI